ncbi:GNAT family N-acetyltransferase [Convivina praedatoris]|uniref:Ribosomal N-acetyltransferase YdaF n=1 Tax=Convivina praedatoris TaxID=2880963 RepID=A0ABN8HDS7_9LACO|nr:GNAT family protein [Convivina sp. LMG 32447]CAH1849889.1 Putative ribosomal N-acetyltransferase YdaF [Convivina sp. LMG 32447]CAH1849893.1 Putative ribosomal N-acetyltransferase YdaF [Convivina sp. LMG 32447]CAH1851349.1 Putative ribosomal N-acetyltransferase YdaF [Convivina sp. LMG 32447]
MFTLSTFTTGQLKVKLALTDEKYAPALFNILKQDANRLIPWLPWVADMQSIDQEVVFIQQSRLQFAKTTAIVLTILVNDQPAGMIDLHKIDLMQQNAEVGYWLGSQYQGQGIMTQALQQVSQYALTELGLHKLLLLADVDNYPSIQVAQGAGFTLEATLKEQVRNHQGQYRDMRLFALFNHNSSHLKEN